MTQKIDTRKALLQIPSYKELDEYVILEGYRGSQAHGTHCPQHPDSIDDVDIMSIVVPPIEDYYLGLKGFGHRGNGTREIKEGKYDVVMYELHKYVNLLIKNNPNVIMLLWLEETYYTKRSKAGNFLINNRDVFSSRAAYYSFCGYAESQLQKMTNWNKDNPNAAFKGYMGEKRKKLVEKYGYDCKNASHLIRLLTMCYEFLTTSKMNVFRHDNKMLIDIKYGGWKLEQVQKEADRLKVLCQEALLHCALPVEVDVDKASDICKECIKLVAEERGVRVGSLIG